MKKIYDSVLDHPAKKSAIEIYGKDPETLDELFDMMRTIVNHNFRVNNENKDIRLTTLCVQVESSNKVSCSHDAPLLGRSKWSSKDHDGPSSYPGFHGRIWYRYNDDPVNNWSDPFKGSQVHTGSGGGGDYDGPSKEICEVYRGAPKHLKKIFIDPKVCSYSFRFFLADFPKIAEGIEKNMTADIIRNITPRRIKFRKEWIEPTQQVIDNEFIIKFNRFRERRVLNRKSVMR